VRRRATRGATGVDDAVDLHRLGADPDESAARSARPTRLGQLACTATSARAEGSAQRPRVGEVTGAVAPAACPSAAACQRVRRARSSTTVVSCATAGARRWGYGAGDAAPAAPRPRARRAVAAGGARPARRTLARDGDPARRT